MEVWARLFARVEICAPIAEWRKRGNQARYAARNVRWAPVRFSNWPGPRRHVLRLGQLPQLRRSLDRLIATTDLLLLRSPSPVALVGRSLARARAAPTITKWAGPARPTAGEWPLMRLERLQVERGAEPVLVYGPTTRSHLIPFIPALMTRDELSRAARAGQGRDWRPPWRLLAIGRLNPEKGFDLMLRGLARLLRSRPDLAWRLELVGDGPQAQGLRNLAERLGLGDRVAFTGAVGFEQARERLARSHVVVMPGTQEGWPKTIAEAWAHGAVPVGAAAGLVPGLLADGAGVPFPSSPRGLADALAGLLADPARMAEIGARGPARCGELSLERFENLLEAVLLERCGLV